jgi:hypothetical protein
MPKRESLACAISLCSIRRRNEVASETRMLARLGRVIYWFTLLLAALVFIAPAVQLVDAWSRKSAPPHQKKSTTPEIASADLQAGRLAEVGAGASYLCQSSRLNSSQPVTRIDQTSVDNLFEKARRSATRSSSGVLGFASATARARA